jgi:hypothetical protein
MRLYGSAAERVTVMSALGQKQTFKRLRLMSALPPKADIGTQSCDVCFVPKADIPRRTKMARYSITSSVDDLR